MVYLARGSFWVSFGQSLNSLLSLLLIIAIANLLPKETYGVYRYILSIAGVLNIFTLTGMNGAVSRATAKGADGVFIPATRYQLKWNLSMFFASYCIGTYYMLQGENTFAAAFFVLGISMPITLSMNTYGAYLQGKKNFKTANILSVLSTLIYTAGILVAIILSDEYIWLVVAYAVTTVCSSIVFYIYTLLKYNPSISKSEDVAETLAYGRKLTYIKLLGPITSQIDKIILGHFWGPVHLAVYSLSTAIPSRIIPALKDIIDIGFPKFATKTITELNSVFYRRILQGITVGFLITICYVFISPYIFKYLLPQYIEGLLYSQILAISFIFAPPTRYIGLLFEAKKMSRQIFINGLINSTIFILLTVILGLSAGLLGLVIAQVLHSFLGLLVNLFSWRKYNNT
jgi:O-antigen/teichoic acid export membrane protein